MQAVWYVTPVKGSGYPQGGPNPQVENHGPKSLVILILAFTCFVPSLDQF